jgi:hypothetical protein
MSFGPSTATVSSTNEYSCGTPGSTTSTYPSSWSFSPPSPYYVWTTSGGASCTSNSNCASGQVCGLNNVPGRSPQFELQCGTQLGWWTANAVCAADESFGSPFNCAQALNTPSGATLDELDRCSGPFAPVSCYAAGAGTSCCGCANWQSVLGTSAVPSYTGTCVSDNPNWNTYILPALQWLKTGAPNIYTYPYDDISSSFTCEQLTNGYNTANYQITLCPGGTSPSGGGSVAIGAGGPYMSTTAPPTQALPQCGAGNTAYYGTGTESVTAYEFPTVSPTTGTWTVQVNYNNAAPRYIHVDVCTTSWNCFTTVPTSSPAPAGTGSVTLTLSDSGQTAGTAYLYSVWTVSTVDEAAAAPYDYKHAWQVYSATLGTYQAQSC